MRKRNYSHAKKPLREQAAIIQKPSRQAVSLPVDHLGNFEISYEKYEAMLAERNDLFRTIADLQTENNRLKDRVLNLTLKLHRAEQEPA